MEFGAQEVALEAPEIFLATPEILLTVPEKVPEVELARELEMEPVMELVKALEIAQSNRWVLSSPPWVSSVVADLPT